MDKPTGTVVSQESTGSYGIRYFCARTHCCWSDEMAVYIMNEQHGHEVKRFSGS